MTETIAAGGISTTGYGPRAGDATPGLDGTGVVEAGGVDARAGEDVATSDVAWLWLGCAVWGGFVDPQPALAMATAIARGSSERRADLATNRPGTGFPRVAARHILSQVVLARRIVGPTT